MLPMVFRCKTRHTTFQDANFTKVTRQVARTHKTERYRQMNPLEFSSPMDAIVPALFTFQENVGPLIKDTDNEYFKSKYADLAAVLDVVKPPLRDAGLLLVQGASTNGGESVNVETTIFHVASLQWVRTILTLRPEKPTPQGCGSAITYARRYGLLAMCGIAAGAPRDYKLNAAPDAQESASPADVQIEGALSERVASDDGKCWFVKVGKVRMWTFDSDLADAVHHDEGKEVVAHGRMKSGGKSYRLISYVPK